jgi:xylulokinase
MYLLGCDIGSSSVKASIVDIESGLTVASDFYPKTEAPIQAPQQGWAEQLPENWWQCLTLAIQGALSKAKVTGEEIKAIGISYQMHGLVVVDKNQNVLRPSIIWCDSRAVSYGDQAFKDLGEEFCLNHLLNSPGNFTASKLAWIKANEPALYDKIDKIMLPGDYIAMRMSGEVNTTISGLSEGMFWDFKNNQVSDELLNYYGFNRELIANLTPTFGHQGALTATAATALGLKKGTPITYRAGDQPNNALSLNVLNPGEIAANAGTSGVVYGVNDSVNYDPLSRVNTFAHVNHTKELTRLGVLLCINGVGILNAWMRKMMFNNQLTYDQLNALAASAPVGSGGISIIPFGNGAERILQNKTTSCGIEGLNFNNHTQAHLARATQEGIVFSFQYGIEIMQQMGIDIRVIRAGHTNMFLSPIFRETLANVTGATIELYDSDGSVGAAKGAGIGAGIYSSAAEAFQSLSKIEQIEPDISQADRSLEAYEVWKAYLKKNLSF